MEYVNKLLEIANNLHLNDQAALLRVFKERLESPNKEILIPLIGEFSSGKTSFINALLDNKNLETASRATTATIFEVRMGADSSKQVIIDSDGKAISVENDILDNKQLSDTQVVCVFDTSNKLDPSIVLVDTPGLSSNDPKHRIALSNYLPNADAILLVVDVNQSPTRSLISFVKDTQVSKRPIYLMLTKCETKTPNEVAQQVKTVVEIIGLPEDNIICTSSHTNDLEQFYSLIKEIQVHKNDIVNEAIKRRIAIVADQIKDFVLELEKNVDSSNDLESAIQDQTRKLKELHTNTDARIEDASCEIEKKEEAAIRIFKDRVLKNLDTIIQSEGRDCDQSVYASVNSVGNMVIELYRQEIQSVLVKLGRDRRHT